MGMFNQTNGIMKHIHNRASDAERAFWNSFSDFLEVMIERQVSPEELSQALEKASIDALESVSSKRNTVHLREHLSAVNKIKTRNTNTNGKGNGNVGRKP